MECTPADLYWMSVALEEAKSAGARGDRAIGCVITLDGALVSRGQNMVHSRSSELEHAEIIALKALSPEATKRVEECVMYTTLEPCPMCISAIAAAGVGHVVYGEADAKRGGGDVLKNVGFVRSRIKSYRGGVIADECQKVRKCSGRGINDD